METKIETLEDQDEQEAFLNGLKISELMVEFNYFWRHTPEGAAARRELESQWLATCRDLKEKKALKGTEFSCQEWFKEISKNLLEPSQEQKEMKSIKEKEKGKIRVEKYNKKKVLKFKNT